MILSDTAIRRPIFTSMIILSFLVFGWISFERIGLDLFPRVEFPVITVLTVLPGADPETLETTVTDPMEEAVSTISGIKHLRSTSSDGVSQLIIEFELSKKVDVAYQEIQAKLGTIRSELPKDMEDPVIEKFDVDSSPILSVLVSGPKNIQRLTHLADKVVKARLQKVPHVGQVKLVGGQDRKFWIWLDRDKMVGYGLTVQQVERAIQSEHLEYPGGRVEEKRREYLIKTKGEFKSAKAMEQLIVLWKKGGAVRLKDIGRVEDGLEDQRSRADLNGHRAIALLVRRQSGTNTVAVAEGVKREVEKLRKEHPKLKIEIAKDLSVYIKQSVEEVHFHMLFGGALALLIVFLFLRNPKSTFISSLVLPTSVMGTFILMNALGFTQNMMTLLALTLSIGLLIDDAIVVQENIMRHVEEGKPAKEAARVATSEIGLAVFATTMSVVAVFVPVAFMKGIVGKFFYQFGMTVAFAVMISMFVSFTLDPMLSSRILTKPKKGWLYSLSERPFLWMEAIYERILGFSLRWRSLVIVLAILSFWGALSVGKYIRSEFVPLEDQSEFNIKIKAPLGSSLVYTGELAREIRKKIEKKKWVKYIYTTLGADELNKVNEGVLYVKMVEKKNRTISQRRAMEWMRRQVAQFSGKITVEIVPRISGGGMKWADVQLEIRGPQLKKLDQITKKIKAKLAEIPGYVDLDTSYEKGKPQIELLMKRREAALLGVSTFAVGSTIKAMVGGKDVAKFKEAGDRYDISVRLEKAYRSLPADLKNLWVAGAKGKLIPLEQVVTVKKSKGPVQINRYNRSRQITLYANLERDKKVLGEAISDIQRIIKELNLPPGYSYGFAGRGSNMQESFTNLFFSLFLAVIVIYMVLASQFESLVQPFIIMLSLPLSLIGALGALVLTGKTVSIFTMIGIIMLMGLVTKNAILLIDYTNTLRQRDGLSCATALLKAGPVRLRPILMTTLAMIFGMLPVALGTGAGSESRSPMAVAVIGGLVTSTVLTLVVVPVVYSLVDGLMVKVKGFFVQK